MAHPSRDFRAGQGNIDWRTLPAPWAKLQHTKGAADDLHAPMWSQALNQCLLGQTGNQQVDIFAWTAEQGISYRAPNQVHAPACYLQAANDRLGERIIHDGISGQGVMSDEFNQAITLKIMNRLMGPVRDTLLIGAQPAISSKFLHVLVQHIPVRIPKTQGFAFGIEPVFTNKFERFFRGNKSHCHSPCRPITPARLWRRP
jgi:hypothetical protein